MYRILGGPFKIQIVVELLAGVAVPMRVYSSAIKILSMILCCRVQNAFYHVLSNIHAIINQLSPYG